jgi:hypothetical protein
MKSSPSKLLLLIATPTIGLRPLLLRCLTLLVGCVGLFWGVSTIAGAELSDGFWYAEGHLLRFETFSHTASKVMLEGASAQDLSPCDNHSQRALMLIEIPLADAALRSGAVQEFDQRIHSLESRAKQTLACAPRDSFVWLMLFGMQTAHGILDEHAFDLLAMSYETAPNEAWIAIRRIVVAIPVLRVAPEPVQQKVLSEFETLIRRGFIGATARAYSDASDATRQLLQTRVDQLDPRSQRHFSEALHKLRS